MKILKEQLISISDNGLDKRNINESLILDEDFNTEKNEAEDNNKQFTEENHFDNSIVELEDLKELNVFLNKMVNKNYKKNEICDNENENLKFNNKKEMKNEKMENFLNSKNCNEIEINDKKNISISKNIIGSFNSNNGPSINKKRYEPFNYKYKSIDSNIDILNKDSVSTTININNHKFDIIKCNDNDNEKIKLISAKVNSENNKSQSSQTLKNENNQNRHSIDIKLLETKKNIDLKTKAQCNLKNNEVEDKEKKKINIKAIEKIIEEGISNNNLDYLLQLYAKEDLLKEIKNYQNWLKNKVSKRIFKQKRANLIEPANNNIERVYKSVNSITQESSCILSNNINHEHDDDKSKYLITNNNSKKSINHLKKNILSSYINSDSSKNIDFSMKKNDDLVQGSNLDNVEIIKTDDPLRKERNEKAYQNWLEEKKKQMRKKKEIKINEKLKVEKLNNKKLIYDKKKAELNKKKLDLWMKIKNSELKKFKAKKGKKFI